MAEVIPSTLPVAILQVLNVLSRTLRLSSTIVSVQIREKEKNKFMKVCVDHIQSALNELQHKKLNLLMMIAVLVLVLIKMTIVRIQKI